MVGDDWDSTPSLSPLNSDDLALDDDDDDSLSSSPIRRVDRRLLEEEDEVSGPSEPELPFPTEESTLFNELLAKQYWRKGWKLNAEVKQTLDIGDHTTLGPSFHLATTKGKVGLNTSRSSALPEVSADHC